MINNDDKGNNNSDKRDQFLIQRIQYHDTSCLELSASSSSSLSNCFDL